MSELTDNNEGIMLVRRDIRAGRRHRPRNPVLDAGHRARQMALSIGGRYISRFRRPPRLNLLLFQPADGVAAPANVTHHHHHLTAEQHRHSSLSLSPRITLTVVNWPQPSAASSPASPVAAPATQEPLATAQESGSPPLPLASAAGAVRPLPADPPVRLRSIQMIWRQETRIAASHATTNAHLRLLRRHEQTRDESQVEIVRRLFRRSSRIEDAPEAVALRRGAAAAISGRRPSRVVPRVLRRPPEAAPAAPRDRPRPDQPGSPARQANWPRPEAAVSNPAPVDINRLTEQVVRNIDRRIIAHRERMGRM